MDTNINSQVPRRNRNGLIGLVLSGMLMLGMLLGGAGAGAVMLATGNIPTTAASTSTQANSGLAATNGSAELVAQTGAVTIGSIYRQVAPSVVKITALVQTTGRFAATGEATGTGIVIDTEGNIITNYHIIEGATTIKVALSDGSEYTATVVGTAQQDDLALLKIDAPSNLLIPAQLGDSATVQVGDEVIAIGNPYDLDQSVTSGIVSGLNRDGAGSDGNRTLSGLIQTDAAINPGNSGGPLVNAKGQVIGINTMIESPVEGFTGVGLAIPIDHVEDLLSQLKGGGQVQRPWLGISGTEITSSMQQMYGLPVSKGVLVVDVTTGGPAAEAGLHGSTTGQGQLSQIGDIIVAIDGRKVSSVADLTSYLNSKQPAEQVTLSILRDGEQQEVTITLQAWASSAGTISDAGNS